MIFRFRQFEVVDDFDQMWSVHSVIDRLTENGVTSYLIQWQPVGEWEDTWKPLWNLNCPKKIAQYKRAGATGTIQGLRFTWTVGGHTFSGTLGQNSR